MSEICKYKSKDGVMCSYNNTMCYGNMKCPMRHRPTRAITNIKNA